MIFEFKMRFSHIEPIKIEIGDELAGSSYEAQRDAALKDVIERHGRWLRGEGGGSRAILSRAILSGVNLSGAILSGATLSGAILSGATLSGAILSGATLSDAILSDAILSRAILSRAILSGATLSGAILSGATLSDAILSDAILSRAILSRAILSGVNLSGAILSGATLSGAILSGATLSGAILSGEIKINRTPIQVFGLPYDVTIWDRHMQIGCQLHELSAWASFDDRRILEMDGRTAIKFWEKWKNPLLAIAAADGRGDLTATQNHDDNGE